MKPIELEVLWHTDDTKTLQDCGMDFDIDEVETRKVTVYGISHIIANNYDDNHEFTTLYTLSGVDYLMPIPYEKAKQIIYQKLN
jgi:hypothetical protein